jgi:hypothetical protein
MLGTDIALSYRVTESRLQDLHAAAKRDRAIGIALAARRRERRNVIAEARTAVAKLLLRAGSWLMPEEAPDAQQTVRPLELRLGR